MPTPKAILICNSHQPTLKVKIAKEYVFANADIRTIKEHRTHNSTYTQAEVSCFVGQKSAKFKFRSSIELFYKTELLCFDFRHIAKP